MSFPQLEVTTKLLDLRFNCPQVLERELVHEDKFEFGQFVAREAVIDEEYWVLYSLTVFFFYSKLVAFLC